MRITWSAERAGARSDDDAEGGMRAAVGSGVQGPGRRDARGERARQRMRGPSQQTVTIVVNISLVIVLHDFPARIHILPVICACSADAGRPSKS
jgi:hypothetical protein